MDVRTIEAFEARLTRIEEKHRAEIQSMQGLLDNALNFGSQQQQKVVSLEEKYRALQNAGQMLVANGCLVSGNGATQQLSPTFPVSITQKPHMQHESTTQSHMLAANMSLPVLALPNPMVGSSAPFARSCSSNHSTSPVGRSNVMHSEGPLLPSSFHSRGRTLVSPHHHNGLSVSTVPLTSQPLFLPKPNPKFVNICRPVVSTSSGTPTVQATNATLRSLPQASLVREASFSPRRSSLQARHCMHNLVQPLRGTSLPPVR